jgi:hypothetical protein
MPSKDPKQRALIAQIATAERWSRLGPEERRAATKKATTAFSDRFERQVDPEGVLDPADRAERARHARRAYFARLALRSAQARRARGAR